MAGFLRHTLNQAHRRAECKELAFDLTFEHLQGLWDKQNGACALSGLPMQMTMATKRDERPYLASLDRIVPKRGYVIGNVRFVLFAINAALNDWGMDEALPIFSALIKRQSELLTKS